MSDIQNDGRESPANNAIKNAFVNIVFEKGAAHGAVVTETEIMRKALAQSGDTYSAQDLQKAFRQVYADGIIPTCYVIVDEDGAPVYDEDGQLSGKAQTLESLSKNFEAKHGVPPYVTGSHVKLPAMVMSDLRETGTPLLRVDAAFVIA